VLSTSRRLQVSSPGTESLESISFGGTIQSGEEVSDVILVDQAVETYVVLWYPTDASMTMVLTSPAGLVINPSFAASSNDYGFDDEDFFDGRAASYSFIAESGDWTISVTNDGADSASFLVSIILNDPDIKLVASLEEPTVPAGKDLTFFGTLTNSGSPLIGSSVKALIQVPGSATPTEISLLDNGVSPDLVADDGIYSATLSTSASGDYLATIVAKGTSPLFTRERFVSGIVGFSQSRLNGIVSETLLDTNGDLLFEQLIILVSCEIDVAGDYRVFGTLTDSLGNTIDSSVETFLSTGSVSVPLIFDGRTLFENGVDGPFVLSRVLLIEGNTEAKVDEIQDGFSTSAISFESFQRSPFRLTGVGSFDVSNPSMCLVTLELETDSRGSYSFSAALKDQFGTQIDFYANRIFLGVGKTSIQLRFNGELIGRNGVDGPYLVSDFLAFGLSRSIAAPGSVFELNLPASTFPGYSPPVVGTTGDGVFTAIDLDENRRIDILRVKIEVESDRPGVYDATASLIDSTSTVIVSARSTTTLASGTSSVTLDFQGDVIGANGVQGPFCAADLQLISQFGEIVSVSGPCFPVDALVENFEGYVSDVPMYLGAWEIRISDVSTIRSVPLSTANAI